MNIPSVGADFAQYRITRELGRGGFATVFAATDRDTGEQVALKVLHTDRSGSYEHATVERFRREVAIVSALTNPCTVRMVASGEEPALWAAFELLAGRNLSEVISDHRVLSAGATAHVLRQVLSALHEAHTLGLVHRDLKPDNIRVFDGDEGSLTIKLIDFGIARATVEGNASVTRTGELIGTPRYMSPEQLSGQPLTPASDIYSLGLIGFELLYGADALKGNSLLDQVARLQDPEMFSQVGSSPEQAHLTDVLRRMVVPDIERRLGSAHAVRAAMRGPATPTVAQRVSEPRARRRAGLIGLAVLLAAVALVYALRGDAPEDVAPPVTRAGEHATGIALTQPRPENDRAALPKSEPEPEPQPEPDPKPDPSPCGSHDGPWPKDDLYVYIPEGADLHAAPFVFVVVAEHWYYKEHLGQTLEYLGLREHADARGFPVVLASIHVGDSKPEEVPPASSWQTHIAQWAGHGFEHTFTPKVLRFYDDCQLTAPAVIFGESSAATRILPIIATPPVFFSAAVVTAIRARPQLVQPSFDSRIPLLIFTQTENKHAPWSGRSVVGEGSDAHEIIGYKAPEVHAAFKANLNCDRPGRQAVETHPGCERQQCDQLFELCIVKGGQWWSDLRPPNMNDARWAAGGTVSGFPYHAVMWDFLDTALEP